MRAARIHRYGGPDELVVEEVPEPRCGPDELLVDVHASSVNPVDFKIRSGGQRAVVWLSLPAALGLDVSGVVREVGAKVRGFAVGDAIWSSPSHRRMGTYAERLAVQAKPNLLYLCEEAVHIQMHYRGSRSGNHLWRSSECRTCDSSRAWSTRRRIATAAAR